MRKFIVSFYGLALVLQADIIYAGSFTSTAAPKIIYTDIISGPNSGGENNKGAYLSIFGKNFGSTGLGTNVKVYINDVEVDNYRYLGISAGRSDIEQITVQIGAIGNPTPGFPLPVKVMVNGASSNTDHTFIVNPGKILFVDNVTGNDNTAAAGDITHPFQHVQTTNASAGAYGQVQPGDIIVMRGKGMMYSDTGLNNCFVRFPHKSGSEPNGQNGTGPIVLMPYPGYGNIETVTITNGYAAISGVDRTNSSYQDGGAWITIAGLHIESSGTAGVINLQIASDHWRIINNDLSEPNASSVHVRAGGITGAGTNIIGFGNSIHDITGSSGENHGIYIDGDGSYDFGYNHIYNINDGYGIQQYNSSDTTHNMLIHHNLIHDVTSGKSCINIADGSASGFKIWNNICYNSRNSGIRFNSLDLIGCQVFNNTFYNTDVSGNYGVIQNDWDILDSSQVTLVNNIVYPSTGGDYLGGQDFGAGVLKRNLWYGAGTSPSEDPTRINGNPSFVAAGSDFHLLAASVAIDSGSNTVADLVFDDYDATTSRPQNHGYDIGAYEYVDPLVTSLKIFDSQKPEEYHLSQNYPNPFNPSTNISFHLGAQSRVSLRIFDILGREIITLINEMQSAGSHTVEWNGINSFGQKVSSGVYFCTMTTETGLIQTQKMILLN
jgi:hypothetical protein